MTPVQYSVLIDDKTEEIQAGYQTAKFGLYFISERNMPKMNGISPPATIHRRLNNNELPIKKTGKIQGFWIFSAPPRATALIIRELRATRTAFCAVIRKGTPQRPTPCAPITYLFFCGICRQTAAVCENTCKKKRCGDYLTTPPMQSRLPYRGQEPTKPISITICGNLSQPMARVSKASLPSVRLSSLSSSVSASFSPRLSLPPL